MVADEANGGRDSGLSAPRSWLTMMANPDEGWLEFEALVSLNEDPGDREAARRTDVRFRRTIANISSEILMAGASPRQ